MQTPICKKLGMENPIFAFTHCRDVVLAVSKAGGIGVLGAVGFSVEKLKEELDWIDARIGDKPYGVDIVIPQKYEGMGEMDPKKLEETLEAMIPQKHRDFAAKLYTDHGVPEWPDKDDKVGLLGWNEGMATMLVEEAIVKIIDRHRSRIPVYDEARGPELIVGCVYSRDLARLMFFRSKARITAPPIEFKLSQVMRDVLVVPETKSALDLIRDFQQRRRHIAIVVDEYGSTVGLVTAEDAIEQLAGELEDEYDSPALPVLTTASGALLMDGGVNLRDLETQMQWDLPRDGGVETLAGFLLMRLGHIPEAGESVTFEGRRLTIMEMEGRRIGKVRVEAVEESGPVELEYKP